MKRLVQTNADVTLDAGSKMDLSLQVELDTDEESGSLLLALVVSGTLQELTCEGLVIAKTWKIAVLAVTYQRAEQDQWRWEGGPGAGSSWLGGRHEPGHQSRSRSGRRGWVGQEWSYSKCQYHENCS